MTIAVATQEEVDAFKDWTDEAIGDGVQSGHISPDLADAIYAARHPDNTTAPASFEIPDPSKAPKE
jgi:hypothetical protein